MRRRSKPPDVVHHAESTLTELGARGGGTEPSFPPLYAMHNKRLTMVTYMVPYK
jgi:hypothetical protein